MRGKFILPSYVNAKKFQSLWCFGPKSVQPIGFVENAPYNGFGRYVCQLQRMTLKFCKFGGSSKGVRDFIENEVVDYCKANPGVAVYLKPRRNKSPVLVCEYLNQSYHWHPLYNMSAEEVRNWIDYFTTRSGDQIKQFHKVISTQVPSVQGAWHPFLNKPTDPVIMTFPSKARGEFIQRKMTATEQLLELNQEQPFDAFSSSNSSS